MTATTPTTPATVPATDQITILLSVTYRGADVPTTDIAIWSVVAQGTPRDRRTAINREIDRYIMRQNVHARRAQWDHLEVATYRELAVLRGHVDLAADCGTPRKGR